MRIVCVSDTHNQLDKIKIPDGDLLLHSGDFTDRGTLQQVAKELCLLGKLPHINKCIIAGNHDFLFQKEPSLAKQIAVDNGLTYLEGSSVEIEGLTIFGSPYTTYFFNWAFNFEEQDLDQAREHWNLIPDNTNIIITHGPPRSILDFVPRGQHVGCGPLLHKLLDLPELLLHSFGHVHFSTGYEQHGNKHFINSSICNEQYHPVNNPYIVDIVNKKVVLVSNDPKDF